jgi:hypothetical protein
MKMSFSQLFDFVGDMNTLVRTIMVWRKELSTLPDGRVPGVRSMLQDKNGYFG